MFLRLIVIALVVFSWLFGGNTNQYFEELRVVQKRQKKPLQYQTCRYNFNWDDTASVHTSIVNSAYYRPIYPSLWVSKPFDWSDWEVVISKEEKKVLLEKLVGNEFFMNRSRFSPNYFHVIDLNGDQLLDVVYEGRNPVGGEIDNFAFFQNNGDDLLLTVKLTGTIVEMSRAKVHSPIKFKVWQWPCCAQQKSTLYEYEYYDRADKEYAENRSLGNYSSSYGKYIRGFTPISN